MSGTGVGGYVGNFPRNDTAIKGWERRVSPMDLKWEVVLRTLEIRRSPSPGRSGRTLHPVISPHQPGRNKTV